MNAFVSAFTEPLEDSHEASALIHPHLHVTHLEGGHEELSVVRELSDVGSRVQGVNHRPGVPDGHSNGAQAQHRYRDCVLTLVHLREDTRSKAPTTSRRCLTDRVTDRVRLSAPVPYLTFRS